MLKLGLCGRGVANASRGDGRGDPKGLLVPKDLDLMKAGAAAPKLPRGAGLALLIPGDPAIEGVPERDICCQGDGELVLMTEWRVGGVDLDGLRLSRCLHRMSSTECSSVGPSRANSVLKIPSIFSVFSS